MTGARHRQVARRALRHRHQRLAALLVLVSAGGLGAVLDPVAGAAPDPLGLLSSATHAPGGTASAHARSTTTLQVSRDLVRPVVVRAADDAPSPVVGLPQAVPGSTPGFVQDDTSVVDVPTRSGRVLAELARGAEIRLTGGTERGYAEVVVDGALAWVAAGDVGDAPPPEEEVAPAVASAAVTAVPSQVSGEPCPAGSAVESGLTSSTITTYRAVCAAFPGLTYGGVRPGDSGEHGTGRALDIMVDTATGHAVAAYLQQNAASLGVDNVIWRQRIWFAGDPPDQWQAMADRGSPTANHMDHVHVGTR